MGIKINKMKNIFFSFFVLVFLSEIVVAQNFAQITTIGGKVYYEHRILVGETLQSIQKIYSCPIGEILNANPGLEKSLNIDKIILIPVRKKTFFHVVKPKETLYSISKLYFVSIDTLVKYNDIYQSVLSVGRNLKIVGGIQPIPIGTLLNTNDKDLIVEKPQSHSNFIVSDKILPDTIISYTILANETLYSISQRFMVSIDDLQKINAITTNKINSGQIIKIPIRADKIESLKRRASNSEDTTKKIQTAVFANQDSFNILIFLPFYLDSSSSQISATKKSAFEYYKGVKLAINELKKLNVKANVYIYDYESKSMSINMQLELFADKKVDLIFAPFDKYEADIVSEWSKQNKVRVVYPILRFPELLIGNEYAVSTTTDKEELIKIMAKELVINHVDETIILIKNDSIDDNLNYACFLDAFERESVKSKKIEVIEATWRNYHEFRKPGKKNQFVFLSSDKKKVVALLDTNFSDTLSQIFGLKEWLTNTEITLSNKKPYNFIYYSSRFIDELDPNYIQFSSSFAASYSQSKLSEFVCYAYDVTLNTCKYLFTGIQENMGLTTKFSFVNNFNGDGFKNTGCFCLKFENYKSNIFNGNK
jgi:LysM repeat protein